MCLQTLTAPALTWRRVPTALSVSCHRFAVMASLSAKVVLTNTHAVSLFPHDVSTSPVSRYCRQRYYHHHYWLRLKHAVMCADGFIRRIFFSFIAWLTCSFILSFIYCPRRLTFTWWGCCGLYQRHKPTDFAHSFLFRSCVCFCLHGPFNCISFHKFSQQLSAFSLCSSGPFLPNWSFQLHVSLWKSSSALI